MTTFYRTISDGFNDYLQYATLKRFLFWKWLKWEYVWRPYCDEVTGRHLGYPGPDDPKGVQGSTLFVNSSNTDLRKFVLTFPIINHYFIGSKIEQKRLEAINAEYWRKKNERVGKVSQV